MKSLPSLLTPHLVLRPLRLEDAPCLCELAGNAQVALGIQRIPQPYTQADAIDFIQTQHTAFNKQREWTWAICQKSDLALIGCINVRFQDEMSAELGYWIGEPYWNHGYATEAARAVVDHVFTSQHLWEFDARHLFGNHAGGRVLTKLGFQLVGFTRATYRGQEKEMQQYRLLHAAWVAKPEGDGFA